MLSAWFILVAFARSAPPEPKPSEEEAAWEGAPADLDLTDPVPPAEGPPPEPPPAAVANDLTIPIAWEGIKSGSFTFKQHLPGEDDIARSVEAIFKQAGVTWGGAVSLGTVLKQHKAGFYVLSGRLEDGGCEMEDQTIGFGRYTRTVHTDFHCSALIRWELRRPDSERSSFNQKTEGKTEGARDWRDEQGRVPFREEVTQDRRLRGAQKVLAAALSASLTELAHNDDFLAFIARDGKENATQAGAAVPMPEGVSLPAFTGCPRPRDGTATVATVSAVTVESQGGKIIAARVSPAGFLLASVPPGAGELTLTGSMGERQRVYRVPPMEGSTAVLLWAAPPPAPDVTTCVPLAPRRPVLGAALRVLVPGETREPPLATLVGRETGPTWERLTLSSGGDPMGPDGLLLNARGELVGFRGWAADAGIGAPEAAVFAEALPPALRGLR